MMFAAMLKLFFLIVNVLMFLPEYHQLSSRFPFITFCSSISIFCSDQIPCVRTISISSPTQQSQRATDLRAHAMNNDGKGSGDGSIIISGSAAIDMNIAIPSSDILHLIQSHLIECGLQATSSTLRSESGGIGLPGLFPTSKGALLQAAQDGRWGEVLQLLSSLDLERCRRNYCEDCAFANNYHHHGNGDGGKNNENGSPWIVTPMEKAVAMVHEMSILELAEQNEMELAFAILRMSSEFLDGALSASGEDGDGMMQQQEHIPPSHDDDPFGTHHHSSSRSGDVERRIAALSAMRDSTATILSATSTEKSSDKQHHLPPNFYGPSNLTRQKRRDQIAKQLKQHIPEVPLKRLSSLLQQSIKWQCHTGVFPTVQRLFQHEEQVNDDDDDASVKKEKSKTKRKSNSEQRFDLVLGNVDVTVGDGRKKKRTRDAGAGSSSNNNTERIPSRVHQTIRLGKRSYIESACFLPDGKGLLTGSSDGFIEIWGETLVQSSSTAPKVDGASADSILHLNSLPVLPTDIDFERLRTSDLAYQRSDDLMMHEPLQSVLAMDVSHDGTLLGTTSLDGTVYIWKILDGKLLRKIERAHGGIGNVNSDKSE